MNYTFKSEDMMLTYVRSRDNGVMRLAIAFHRRESIGALQKHSDSPLRYLYITTPEFDEWAATFLGMPGLKPCRWSVDPQHEGFDQLDMDPATRIQFMKDRGPKRDILVLDTEEQAMLFKMRWQDET